ncbi:MAG: GDP-mannose 4,6-dehydratase [Candidatus Rokubacteria bacterium]|nr:GDP-mannose 4,6-dehydratase [Candidatus Rokubacteria bacterium]
MRLLITGITGFVGSYLAELALEQGLEVCGSCRWRSKTENIEHIRHRIRLIDCDLRDQSSVQNLLDVASPDYIAHLAAQSFVAASWQAPAETFNTNVISQVNLLEALRARRSRARFLVIGSSEEYGTVYEDELPIRETNPLRPLSPYAVSKVAQDLMGYQYFKSYGMPIVRTRAFNHEGPRRGDVFVTSNFARQIAEIEAGHREPVIEVGNLKSRRDYTDVRDVVRGYWLLLERGEPGDVYNLCSGKAWRIQDVLEFLTGEARVRGIAVREDAARFRPSDVPVLLGDASKIWKAVGWQPELPFEQTLRDVLEYWRRRVAHGPVAAPNLPMVEARSPRTESAASAPPKLP